MTETIVSVAAVEGLAFTALMAAGARAAAARWLERWRWREPKALPELATVFSGARQ